MRLQLPNLARAATSGLVWTAPSRTFFSLHRWSNMATQAFTGVRPRKQPSILGARSLPGSLGQNREIPTAWPSRIITLMSPTVAGIEAPIAR
jgi:hypothetical protein